MIAALGFVLDGIMLIGTLVAWGVETVVNAGLAAVAAVWAVVILLLPSMPDIGSIGVPSWLHWLNWFYPVGDLLIGLTAMVAVWIAFLAVRFILRLIRQV